MAEHDRLYRDQHEDLAKAWERDMSAMIAHGPWQTSNPIYHSVIEWSEKISSGDFSPVDFRKAIESLMSKPSLIEVGAHYSNVQPEDQFVRLALGQPVRIHECTDYCSEAFGSVPSSEPTGNKGGFVAPVSYVLQLIDDVNHDDVLGKLGKIHCRDEGCGTGVLVAILSLLQNWKISALDLLQPHIDTTKRTVHDHLGETDVAITQGDILQTKIDNNDLLVFHCPFGDEGLRQYIDHRTTEVQQKGGSFTLAALHNPQQFFDHDQFTHVNDKDGETNGFALFRCARK